jgi:hypothetical protein
MVRLSIFAFSSFLIVSTIPAYAATVDGRLVSIDSERRVITLETGEMLNLTEYVVLDGLEPGQVVRVTYTDETIDATAVDILEYNPPVETVDEPASETPQ